MDNDKILFLNSEVEKEVKSDEGLYIAWRLMCGVYDWEIDPIHNIHYRQQYERQEVVRLKDIKDKIASLKEELYKSYIVDYVPPVAERRRYGASAAMKQNFKVDQVLQYGRESEANLLAFNSSVSANELDRRRKLEE